MRVITASGLESQFFMRVNTACISNWIRTGIRELWDLDPYSEYVAGKVYIFVRVNTASGWECQCFMIENTASGWKSMFYRRKNTASCWECLCFNECEYASGWECQCFMIGNTTSEWKSTFYRQKNTAFCWECLCFYEWEYRLWVGKSMFLWYGIPPLAGKGRWMANH